MRLCPGRHVLAKITEATLLLVLFAVATACDEVTTVQAAQEPQVNLVDPLEKEWAELLLSATIGPSQQVNSTPPDYRLEPACPLTYDFSLYWPLRPELSSETMGRFEMRPDPRNPEQILLKNRATGAYPVHRSLRHRGYEWWDQEIPTVTATLNQSGLVTENRWPGAWLAPHPPLGLAAFFPALPDGEEKSWALHATANARRESRSLQLITQKIGAFTFDGGEVVVVDARPAQGGQRFYGRYLFSAQGRILASIWTVPSSHHHSAALATLRLTSACNGVVLAPRRQGRNAVDAVIDTWTRFISLLHDGELEALLPLFDASLREEFGDEPLLRHLDDEMRRLGARAFSRPLPHSITEADGLLRFRVLGHTADDESTPIITEITARQDTQGDLRLLRIRATTDESRLDWNLFDLNAHR